MTYHKVNDRKEFLGNNKACNVMGIVNEKEKSKCNMTPKEL